MQSERRIIAVRQCATKARRCANDLDTLQQPCCMRDEGRPLGIGVQAQVPNRPKLHGSRALVVSVREKARLDRVR